MNCGLAKNAFSNILVNVSKICSIYLFSSKLGIGEYFSRFVNVFIFFLRVRYIYLSYELRDTYESHAGLP